ncbi:MAG TPA: glycosyltransferase family 87 protein [Gaiellaceae bacterium]|nr:glycosyltransferase family 87 protein [Gaiellaceae bacterium]
MGERRTVILLGAVGVLLFLGCCLLVAGGPFDAAPYGDVHLYRTFAHRMARGQLPYRDFFDEYPPFAQPLFYLVKFLPGTYLPGFRWAMALLGAGSVGLMAASLASVHASRTRTAFAMAAAGIAPLAIGPIFLNAYDLWPAFLLALAILAFVRGRERTAYVLLALGAAAKIYPLVLLPLAVVESWERGGRERVRSGLAWFAGALVLVHLPFAVLGPGGLRYSYWLQLKRGLEVESLGGSFLFVLDRLGLAHVTAAPAEPGSLNAVGTLADALGTVSSLVELAAILLVAWLFWRRRRLPFVAAAAAVLGFVAFGKVFSPQYVDWLVPLVPAAGPVAAVGTVAVAALTHVVFDRFHDSPAEAVAASVAWWAFVRNLVVVALYGVLVARLARRPRSRTA